MTPDEEAIVEFLKGYGEAFVSRKEIARKAVPRRIFDENPHWVDAPLVALTDQHILEKNDSAHYRLADYN